MELFISANTVRVLGAASYGKRALAAQDGGWVLRRRPSSLAWPILRRVDRWRQRPHECCQRPESRPRCEGTRLQGDVGKPRIGQSLAQRGLVAGPLLRRADLPDLPVSRTWSG